MAPRRRIWLYPIGSMPISGLYEMRPRSERQIESERALEIVVLGEPHEIAAFVTELRAVLEAWSGFEAVRPLVMGAQQIGFTVARGNMAEHADPVAEAMLALRRFSRIEWHATIGAGMVGTW